ncbi:MAG: single-stranded-DNA-specific exonuclease RecJ [Spirochaetaceae bacterium]|jgi:single-stranded-DNA-specific exonuclease|nr:single-stranded-DNA-specific exonuclease RecJ [Spirochaetaceae bacterium]
MNWEKRDIPPELVKNMAVKYGCDLLTASIFARRDITGGEDIRYFLEDDLRHLRNPFELPGMEDAVERIMAARDEGEKVLVFGDRDVDGITSTTLLGSFLARQGLDVSWRLPQGDEPYGLSLAAVEDFAAEDGTLIITVDCGVSNVAEIRRARELGLDVIVTDHHNPREELPAALAIVNPKLASSSYPFRDLAGCGVTYKLVWALRFALKSETYGQSISLLLTRPSNDAYIIEIAKLRNLTVIDRLIETVVPGMVGIAETRLPAFLRDQQIFTWDAPLQKKTLAKIFGGGVEINMVDIAAEIGKEMPQTEGKSLLRLKELSRIARYSAVSPGELDVFISLFISFIQKRERLFTDEDALDLQLACLGTVADIMPLRDENRIIVRQGLGAMTKTPRPGIQDLLFKLGLAGRRISAGDLSWHICPAINAAGRMGEPDKAVELLLQGDARERDRLAGELKALNEDRRKLGEDAWSIVEPLAEESRKDFSDALVMAAGENINRGITGLMAARLVSRFKKPALVAALGTDTAMGSLRSLGGYKLPPLLEPCADLFRDWGGHNYAAGFSMDRANWAVFLDRLRLASRTIELEEAAGEETLTVDAELPLAYLKPDIFSLVDRFEPYGEGNSPLTFLVRGMRIAEISLMGKPEAKHVRFLLDTGRYKWPAVYWQAAEKVNVEFALEDRADVVFKITRNWFNNAEVPQLVIFDLKARK